MLFPRATPAKEPEEPPEEPDWLEQRATASRCEPAMAEPEVTAGRLDHSRDSPRAVASSAEQGRWRIPRRTEVESRRPVQGGEHGGRRGRRRPVRGGDEEEEVKALMADIMAANALIAQAAYSISDIEAANKLIAKAKLGTAGEV